MKFCVAHWTMRFGPNLPVSAMIDVCEKVGFDGIELTPADELGPLRSANLSCPVYLPTYEDGTPPFAVGLWQDEHRARVVATVKNGITVAKANGIPNVIVFSGCGKKRLDWRRSAIEGLAEVVGFAESEGVTLLLEHLNSRDLTHPMKGHEGYLADDLDEVSSVVREIGSKRLRLLFDFYHVQIMHGDLIRRMQSCLDIIGHVHVAGVPGRGTLAGRQEVHFANVVAELRDAGYRGWMGHEFIFPEGADQGIVEQQLRESLALCR